MTLDATENFLMRPSHVAGWSEAKRDLIQGAFLSTVVAGTNLRPEPGHLLF
ncbi:hypothetical protein [Methylobacterium sp. D54C]